MTTYKLIIAAIALAAQDLALTSESVSASTLVEVLDADQVTVIGSTSSVPGEITGLSFPDLSATYFIRASGIDSTGTVMGVPSTHTFVPAAYLPTPPADPVDPAPPAPTTRSVALPSGVTFSLAAE